MARRYRRKSEYSSVLNDTVFILSKLPWWGSLIFGLFTFTLFYWLMPMWIQSNIDKNSLGHFHNMMQLFADKHINKFHWLAYACAIASLFFAIRNYYIQTVASSNERGIISFISKLLGKGID